MHTRCSPPALLSPGGSKVVISLFQILIWQQLLPVARLPLGRQSPFKSLLPTHPPINTNPVHQPPSPTGILNSPPSSHPQARRARSFLTHPSKATHPPLHPTPVWLWQWHRTEFTHCSRWHMDALESAAIQEKRFFYNASALGRVYSTSSMLKDNPCVLWYGFPHSAQPGLVE